LANAWASSSGLSPGSTCIEVSGLFSLSRN
jgi:hypothetical protein